MGNKTGSVVIVAILAVVAFCAVAWENVSMKRLKKAEAQYMASEEEVDRLLRRIEVTEAALSKCMGRPVLWDGETVRLLPKVVNE